MKTRRVVLKAFAVLAVASTPGLAAEAPDFSPDGFFLARPDLRMCPSPLCGGYFLKQVNRKLTRCSDGTLQPECHVASLRKLPAGASATRTPLLLQGRIRSQTHEGIGEVGTFLVRAAWSAASDTSPRGPFVGIENNGTVCITTPCFSFDQYVLNRPVVRQVSGLDLAASGASPAQQDEARKILAAGGALIAAGVNKQVVEAGGTGLVFGATQFFLPLP